MKKCENCGQKIAETPVSDGIENLEEKVNHEIEKILVSRPTLKTIKKEKGLNLEQVSFSKTAEKLDAPTAYYVTIMNYSEEPFKIEDGVIVIRRAATGEKDSYLALEGYSEDSLKKIGRTAS